MEPPQPPSATAASAAPIAARCGLTAPWKLAAGAYVANNDRIAPGDTARGRQAPLTRALDWLGPGDNPAGLVYGTLLIGTLLAAETAKRETFADTVCAVTITLLAYWLAHSYAHALGNRLRDAQALTAAALGHAILAQRAIVKGAGAPLLVLLICWAAGASLTTALSAALWTCAGAIVYFELVAGLRARLRPRELILQTCAGTAMGLALIALRALLH